MNGTSLKGWPAFALLAAFLMAFIAADFGSGKGILKDLGEASILGGPGTRQASPNSSGW